MIVLGATIEGITTVVANKYKYPPTEAGINKWFKDFLLYKPLTPQVIVQFEYTFPGLTIWPTPGDFNKVEVHHKGTVDTGFNAITAEIFERYTELTPSQDDLDRCNCMEAGGFGHLYCGWCATHNLPRFMCSCSSKPEAEKEV